MRQIDQLQKLLEHLTWADERIEEALQDAAAAVPEAVREYAHVIGSQENWLARLEGRPPRAAVWPSERDGDLARLARRTHEGLGDYLADLSEEDLERTVTYTNSAGQTFSGTPADILQHVFLHAQYHRGKINLLLRQHELEPAPTDYIAFTRGVPAATQPPPRATSD